MRRIIRKMKRLRIVNKKRFIFAITIFILMSTIITAAAQSFYTIDKKLYKGMEYEKKIDEIKSELNLKELSDSIHIQLLITPAPTPLLTPTPTPVPILVPQSKIVSTPVPIIKQNMNDKRKQLACKYLINYKVPEKRARDLVDWIFKYAQQKKISEELVLAIMNWETDFLNISGDGGDSMGYGQVQLNTIKDLKKWDPFLPFVRSLDDFQKDPETQIRYIVANIKYGNALFGNDYFKTVSNYNMGTGNTSSTRYNPYYVNKVTAYKNKIDQYIN